MLKLETEQDGMVLLRAARALAVVSAWTGAGLFEVLREGPKAIGELPGDARALATTVPVLRNLGLVAGPDGALMLTTAARRLLDAGQMPTPRNLEFMRDASRMQELIERGGPVLDDAGKPKVTDGGVTKDGEERMRAFLDMLHGASEASANETFAWVHDLSGKDPTGRSMLDLGGGHGRYARTFADAGYRATLFDFPHVIAYARERHGDALAYLDGNFRDVSDFGGPYDVVLLSNIVHGEPDENNAALVKKLAACLNPGGILVLKDMFLDEHGSGPDNAVYFGMVMLNYTAAGRSHTVTRARAWLTDAGLTDAALAPFDTYQLITAKKA